MHNHIGIFFFCKDGIPVNREKLIKNTQQNSFIKFSSRTKLLLEKGYFFEQLIFHNKKKKKVVQSPQKLHKCVKSN